MNNSPIYFSLTSAGLIRYFNFFTSFPLCVTLTSMSQNRLRHVNNYQFLVYSIFTVVWVKGYGWLITDFPVSFFKCVMRRCSRKDMPHSLYDPFPGWEQTTMWKSYYFQRIGLSFARCINCGKYWSLSFAPGCVVMTITWQFNGAHANDLEVTVHTDDDRNSSYRKFFSSSVGVKL